MKTLVELALENLSTREYFLSVSCAANAEWSTETRKSVSQRREQSHTEKIRRSFTMYCMSRNSKVPDSRLSGMLRSI